jgi:hypothetical protein
VPESLRLKASRWLAGLAIIALGAGCDSTPLHPAAPQAAGGEAAAAGGTPGGGEASAEPVVFEALKRVTISSDANAEHFQRASAEVDFGHEPVARAAVSITLESPCFPFAGWADPPVPSGQRWPEPCDAFDRTVSLTLDELATDAGGTPGLELLRAITPFGGPLLVEADVTDVVNGLPGAHQLGLRIDTWSDPDGLVSGAKGEWIASVDLTLWQGAAPRHVLTVVPLELITQTEVDAPAVQLEVPEGATSARLEYRATGHGAAFAPGCIGPAEEFCRRTHELRLDGEVLTELSPWRDDCASLCTMTANDSGYGPSSYCAENPCGAPESVRAPRANWCPGSMTPPFAIEAPALLMAGPHELTRSIPELATGGSWLVSATYFAFE